MSAITSPSSPPANEPLEAADSHAQEQPESIASRSSGYVLAAIIMFALAVATVLAAVGVVQDRFRSLEIRLDAVSATVPEIDARELLAEINDLKEQLDSGINSFNSLIDWTQFVGIAIALVAGVAAVVGLRDSRKDREELQRVITLAENRLAETQVRLFDAQSKLNEAQNKLAAAESTILTAQEKLDDVKRLDAAVKASSKQVNATLEKVDATAEDVAKLRRASAAAQIGQRQLALDNLREATRLFEVALEYNPDDETIIYLWADAWLRLNGKQGASEAYKRLQSLHTDQVDHPSASALYAYSARLLGDQAEDEGAETEAADYYTISEKVYRSVRRKNEFLLDSFGESVFGGLAGLYRRQAKSDPAKRSAAIQAYNFCRAITPNSSYVLNNLALLQYCEDPETAKKTFERCYKLAEKKRGDIQNDYWAIFDSVTARIALGHEAQSLMEDLNDGISLVHSRARDGEPVRKLLSGLEELQCIAEEGQKPIPEPPALQEIMAFVRTQLNPRQGP